MRVKKKIVFTRGVVVVVVVDLVPTIVCIKCCTRTKIGDMAPMSSTHSSNSSKPLASLSQSYHGKTGHSAVSPQRSTLLSVFRGQKMPPSKRLEETLAEVSSNAEMHMIPPLRRVDPTGAAKGESARRSFYTTLPVVTDVYQDRLTETGSSGRPSFLYCQKPDVLPSYKEATTLDLAECVGVGIPVQSLAGPPEFRQTPAKDYDAKDAFFCLDQEMGEAEEAEATVPCFNLY